MKTRDILTLSQVPGITQARLRIIIPQARVLPLLDEPALRRLAESHRWFSLPDPVVLQQAKTKAEEIRVLSQEQDIRILSVLDEAYPQSLARIKDAPPLLYLKGNIALLDDAGHQRAAVIGARKILPRTQRIGKTIMHYLLKDNTVIISGLALGSDSLAHQAAVDAERHDHRCARRRSRPRSSCFQPGPGPGDPQPQRAAGFRIFRWGGPTQTKLCAA